MSKVNVVLAGYGVIGQRLADVVLGQAESIAAALAEREMDE